MAITSDAAIEANATSEPFIGRRLPNRMITKKAMPGMTGISQAFSRNHPVWNSAAIHAAALHLAELVEADRTPVAVDEEHHAQPDADLGGGDGDDVDSAKTCPSTLPCMRAKAIRLRLTALRISSTDISTITALRRAITPYTPMQNSTAPRRRKLTASSP